MILTHFSKLNTDMTTQSQVLSLHVFKILIYMYMLKSMSETHLQANYPASWHPKYNKLRVSSIPKITVIILIPAKQDGALLLSKTLFILVPWEKCTVPVNTIISFFYAKSCVVKVIARLEWSKGFGSGIVC